MKMVFGTMVFFTIVMIVGGGFIGMPLTKILGGGIAESYIYPIYVGIIFLSGLIVACTVIIIDEFKEVKAMLLEKNKDEIEVLIN